MSGSGANQNETTAAPEPQSNPTESTTAETASSDQRIPSGEVEYPLGLSADGVSPFLYGTHLRTLSRLSFRAAWTKYNSDNGNEEANAVYHADQEGALGRWRNPNGGPVEMYRSRDGSFWREDLGGRTTYGEDDPKEKGRNPSVWGLEVAPLVRALEWSAPELVDESRPVVWEVTPIGVADDSVVPGWGKGTMEDVAGGRMTIDETGVIKSITVGYRIIHHNRGETQYRVDYSVDSVGKVSVDPPKWLPTARSSSPVVDTSLTSDRQFVRAVVTSGNRIEPGTWVSVYNKTEGTNFSIQLRDPIHPDEPVYLYKGSKEDLNGGVAEITRENPPENAPTESLSSDMYHLTMERDGAMYYTDYSVDIPSS